MTAVIDGVIVTGTVEEISQLIKIHNSKTVIGTTPIPPYITRTGTIGGGIPDAYKSTGVNHG